MSAGGIRPGVINTLTKYMPVEFVVCMTGHEMKGGTAAYEYIDAQLALCMPGALVLAGWPKLPWGQLGDGPTPADISVLFSLGVSAEELAANVTNGTNRQPY